MAFEPSIGREVRGYQIEEHEGPLQAELSLSKGLEVTASPGCRTARSREPEAQGEGGLGREKGQWAIVRVRRKLGYLSWVTPLEEGKK